MRVASVIMNEISTFLLVQLRQNEKQYYVGEHTGDGGRQEALWTCAIVFLSSVTYDDARNWAE